MKESEKYWYNLLVSQMIIEFIYITKPHPKGWATRPNAAINLTKAIPCKNPGELSENSDHAVQYTEFIENARGKTLHDLTVEEGGPDFFNLTSTSHGPDAEYRFVKDPANPNAVIDMRHFIVVGQLQSEVRAIGVEVGQWINPGWRSSAFRAQDIYSNYLGFDFFKNYYQHSSELEFAQVLARYFEIRALQKKIIQD